MMSIQSSFVRDKARALPSIFVPVRQSRGRPREEFEVRVSSEQDAELATENGVPMFVVGPRQMAALGYPLNFPPVLVVARSQIAAIRSPLKLLAFNSESAVADPKIEDVVVALLTVDPIAARAVFERNRDSVDLGYLLKRLFSENLERIAAWVRFTDILPALPKSDLMLSRSSLDHELAKNLPRLALA
jgi:hypothetical protein